MKTRTISKGWRCSPGDFVKIRPCADEHGGKTFLGIAVGDVSAFGESNDKPYPPNPCFWVPDLGEYIFGFESWWGKLEAPDDLKQITDADIDNVWYVKALKALSLQETVE